MKLLAIDTSTDACSVALLAGNDTLFDHRVQKQKHGELLLPMVDALMAQAGLSAQGLDGLVYGCGPGSFTGVRIGVACAQGIALGADIGVVGVSTLRCIAQGCHREFADREVAVSVDARMGEVYFCSFRIDDARCMQAIGDEQLLNPASLPHTAIPSWAGSGAERYSDEVAVQAEGQEIMLREDRLPHALDHLTLGEASVRLKQLLPAEMARPVYLRNKVALTSAERKASS